MRTGRLLLATLAVVVIAAALVVVSTSVVQQQDGRSVRPLPLRRVDPRAPFDAGQSAALFVGVREFEGDVAPVRYAVDDAIDLAHAFSLAGRSSLVAPPRVVLALSGQPQKEESRARLRELRDAGAVIAGATRDDIESLLRRQSELAGPGGILVVSFATHGFLDDGVHYLLGGSSTLERETAVPAARVLDITSMSTARRSLILVDACRERVPSGSRGAAAGPPSTAPLVRRMTRVAGQVVLYAAAAGRYAYDDEQSRNGVFTKAVLDGLACKAPLSRGVVTADTLARYVEKRVRPWVQKHRDPTVTSGIQVSMEGDARLMPLAVCHTPCKAAARPGVDLDGDCANEAVVLSSGKLRVIASDGRELWSAGDRVHSFVTTDLFRKKKLQVVALSNDRMSIFDSDGTLLSSCRGVLRHVAVDKPTSRHAPKIIVAGTSTVLLFDPKKVGDGTQIWGWSLPVTIEAIEIVDYDRDGRRDISLRTARGQVVLDFDGHPLNGVRVVPLPRK